MTLDEFYAFIGGDIDGVRGRLREDEKILKYVGFFMEDPTYDTLVSALEAQNYTDAFRAAHTMKGLAANLGFSALETAASELTEALRGETPVAPAPELFTAVQTEYTKIANNLPA